SWPGSRRRGAAKLAQRTVPAGVRPAAAREAGGRLGAEHPEGQRSEGHHRRRREHAAGPPPVRCRLVRSQHLRVRREDPRHPCRPHGRRRRWRAYPRGHAPGVGWRVAPPERAPPGQLAAPVGHAEGRIVVFGPAI
ncbi:unnamed protein product, partial [Prorocentrum cordatum]